MEDRELARRLAMGRTAVGVSAVVAPTLILRGWMGPARSAPGVQALGRAFGIRDALLGLATLQALDRDEHVREWLLAGAAADATDCVASLLAFKGLRKMEGVALVALAGGAAALCGILASRWG